MAVERANGFARRIRLTDPVVWCAHPQADIAHRGRTRLYSGIGAQVAVARTQRVGVQNDHLCAIAKIDGHSGLDHAGAFGAAARATAESGQVAADIDESARQTVLEGASVTIKNLCIAVPTATHGGVGAGAVADLKAQGACAECQFKECIPPAGDVVVVIGLVQLA